MGSGQRVRRTTNQGRGGGKTTTPQPNASVVPGYTGGQMMSSTMPTNTRSISVVPNYAGLANLPQPGAFQNQQVSSPMRTLTARSTTQPRSVVDLIAGPYRGQTPEPQFTGSLPRFDVMRTGPVPQQDVSQPQPWRNILGLQQGVTYQTEQPALTRQPSKRASDTPLILRPPAPQYDASRTYLGGVGDRIQDRDKARNPWLTPYGDLYYSIPLTDYANQSPGLSATGVFDDTLKYKGTGTTTALYDPSTLQGRQRPIDMTITPKAQSVASNWSALPTTPTVPAYTGQGGGYGGGGYGGGGGGWGGGQQNMPPWYYGLMNWRI